MKPSKSKTKSSQPEVAAYTINLETITASVDDAKATLDALYLMLNAVVNQLSIEQGRKKK
jgi:hypothetical protein